MTEYSHTIRISPLKGRSIEHLNELDLISFVNELLPILYCPVSETELLECLFREVSNRRNTTEQVLIDVDLRHHRFFIIVREIRNLFNQFPFAVISQMEIVENKLPIPKGEDLLSHH